jgi:hypothetical protein
LIFKKDLSSCGWFITTLGFQEQIANFQTLGIPKSSSTEVPSLGHILHYNFRYLDIIFEICLKIKLLSFHSFNKCFLDHVLCLRKFSSSHSNCFIRQNDVVSLISPITANSHFVSVPSTHHQLLSISYSWSKQYNHLYTAFSP